MATLPPGTRVGPYEVRSAIGAGGMGQVFRAYDTSLHREVALKILPPDLAGDAEYQARFSREARLLAALNHPHIAQVYGLEDSVAGPAIAMEFVSGVTLHDRVRSGVPRAEAMRLAHQIATALDAAHEKGIVHRDLKPANIMVTSDGAAKVLDFGIAKTAIAPEATAEHDTMLAVTVQGAVVGTPAYMSPEQARGQAVDRRTDIWAFGCVLYELLAGQAAFKGESSSDLFAAILEREPDWRALPPDTPGALRRLLQRCLEKDRRRRLRDIGDALDDLAAPWDAREATTPAPRRAVGVMTMALIAAALATGSVATWWILGGAPRGGQDLAPLPIRFALPPPAGATYSSGIEAIGVSVSPDGSTVAFVAFGAGGPSKIVLRSLDDETLREVPGTDGAISMFWSPDGQSLGFFVRGQLKRVEMSGGAPVKVCDVPISVGLSGSWGRQGDILFATVQGDRIFRVSAGGGVRLTRWRVEGGRRLLGCGRDTCRMDDDFFTRSSQPILRAGSCWPNRTAAAHPWSAATSQAQWIDPDWLVFVREGTVVGQRVDLAAGQTVGEPVSIIGPVPYSAATGWSNVSASTNGTIAVQWHSDESRIAWFDRGGTETGHVGNPGTYTSVRLSPDATTLLFTRVRTELGTRDIWKTDPSRPGIETPVTTSPGMETGAAWLPGARAVVFAAAQGGPPNLFHKDLTSGVERRLLTSPRFQFPNVVTADGSQIIYQQRTELGDWDLMLVSLADASRVTTLFAGASSEQDARLAPDGTHLSFTSDESGRAQVYVAAFPVTGAKTAASSAGGSMARWRRDGRELYFISSDNQLMAVPIDAAGAPGQVRALFDVPRWLEYDVASDGRFVAVVADVIGAEQPLAVFVNWRGR